MSNPPLLDKRMFLGAIPLFGSLSESALDELLQQTSERKLAAHKVVVAQGDPGSDMFIITSGSVDVSLTLADNEQIIVGKLAAGDAFGEIALFDTQIRSATVTTRESCHFLVIHKEDFISYLMRHPQVAIQLLGTLSKRLRAGSDLLQDTMAGKIEQRLAVTLSNIARAYGQQTRFGLRVDIPFGDVELAQIAEIPTAVAKAQLQHWCKDGIISREKHSLTVLKPTELESKILPVLAH
ncbi:MAG: Crp/Fnr family transcriptional regulator [Gammaproteobacteria bacterium]|nr:Crp/Fnr family transcriptional regulator [Gammaproteobacteria bacterium]MDH5799422.1 Crp/Fnr family transcriptional regulator [Gammaproteobacteria bacterium]